MRRQTGADAVYPLRDMDGVTHETILYVYDGQLRELLCERGWELAFAGEWDVKDTIEIWDGDFFAK